MEYIILIGVFLLCGVFVVVLQIRKDRIERKYFIASLKKNYGVLKERKYSPDRFSKMDTYFRKHPQKDQLDDITWNDLGMDELFKRLNYTFSAVGEEYLYYTLRNVGNSIEELEAREKLISYFMKHEEQRIHLQCMAHDLGYLGKYSLYDYLDQLDYLGERSNKKHYFMILLYLLSVALMPFQFTIGFVIFFALIVINVVNYFKEKKEIEPYIISFTFITRLMKAGEKFLKMPGLAEEPKIMEMTEMVKKNLRELKPLESSVIYLGGGGMKSGNPLEIVIDYINMFFHIDLIRFNKMLSLVRNHIDDIDGLSTVIGKIEMIIAVGAWRKNLQTNNGYCIPKLYETHTKLVVKNGYHPMVTNPVRNSIDACKSILLTGSNASGKSTFLKMTAINAIFAQTIHTACAESYEAPMFRIFSSMALKDDLIGKESYYIVEIKALGRILKEANTQGRQVLCFIDEVLRGTNTVERIAASCEILKNLQQKGTRCFAATHDIELTDLLSEFYDNYHFEEEIKDGDIVFPYRLMEGKATTRNAIRLLSIIGYEEAIIENAEKRAERFIASGTWS